MIRRLTGHPDSDPGSRERRDGIAPNGKPYESVWDYPRPPVLDPVEWTVRIVHNEITIVDAPRAVRVLETSQPPAYYVAPAFVDLTRLVAGGGGSVCEWKGVATYASVVAGDRIAEAACWSYPDPTEGFRPIAGFWAFYAQKLDECWIDDERVEPNPGMFYGGWLTANVTGPVKGGPGTQHW